MSLRARTRIQCFSLVVIDVMLFTGHGISVGDLGDRLGVNLTLLLTAMAFKWVLNEGIPNVPYLTLMEVYVICSFAVLFTQGICFWFLADAFNYRCGEDEEDSFYRDWITGTKMSHDNSTETKAVLSVTCENVHVADRIVFFLELCIFIWKNTWFLYRAYHNSQAHVKLETGFYDLSRLVEYRGEYLNFEGDETQLALDSREDQSGSGRQGSSVYVVHDEKRQSA